MSLSSKFFPYTLKFTFAAGTSRGILTEKTSWFLIIRDGKNQGWGEAGPLPGLSPESESELPAIFEELSRQINGLTLPGTERECFDLSESLVSDKYPSVRFALETALLDLFNGARREIVPTDFYSKSKPIPINGLIWMGDEEFMRDQFRKKQKEGFTCFKMKVGAIDFQRELEILSFIRQFTDDILRVDANGAFDEKDVFEKLEKLAELNLHSIEQPVKAGQWDLMAEICRYSPVDVALDEELIGIHDMESRRKLLETIRPKYIILKPTLIGGIRSARQWIDLADEYEIGWWLTSALESNIGLNAICQFTDSLPYKGHQGLGTGMLYSNNIPSPLVVSKGEISYHASQKWILPKIPSNETNY
jgi:o-succinylbenzoate synthase